MTTAAEATKDILLGYGKRDQAALASLVKVQDWQVRELMDAIKPQAKK